MAAILKLRRGTSIPSLVESELFFDATNKTVVVGDGSVNHTLVKIGTNTGDITFDGDITATNLTLLGNATVQGNITFGGSLITLGDEDTDDIVFVGELSSSLVPNNDNAFDIGSSTRRYKTVYGVSASFENVSLLGTGILSSSLQDFDTYSSSIESQLESVYSFTESADQRLTSIEGFTQSVDLRVDNLEASQSYFDNTFSGSVDSRIESLNSYTESNDQRVDSLEIFSQSVDLRVTDLELTGSDHEGRIIDLEFTSSDQEFRIDEIETTFSSSVDLRLDNAELTGSNHENRIIDLESTGSDHELRIDEIETTFSSSVDQRLDLLENFSSSEYQDDSSSFDARILDLRNVTGSYATTGSNTFIGDQIITGSLLVSGAQLQVQGLNFPPQNSVVPFLSTIDYTLTTNAGNRTYTGFNFSLSNTTESVQDVYENAFILATYGPNGVVDYGSEFNISPLRNHLRVYASGSDSLANMSVEDAEDGTTRGLFYADDIQIGVYTGSNIEIGNDNSLIRLDATNFYVDSPITSSNTIQATKFYGDGSELYNVTASYVEYVNVANKPTLVSGSSQINVNQTQNFQPFSQSVDTRLDELEGPFSSSVNQQLTSIHSYTSSLKNAIEVSGQNLTVFGDLVVEGTTTTINTEELLIEDKLLAIASGSTTSTDADGGGFFISGANASILWNHLDQTLDFNTKVSSSVGFKGDGSELTNISYQGIVFDGSGIVSGSIQIDLTQTTNYSSGIKDRLNIENVFSSSQQVNADSITNFDSNVKDKINDELVHSGSYLGTATTNNLDEGIDNLYYTDDRVKTKLNLEGVVSQSSQINVNNTQNFTPFSSSVDSRIDSLEIFSSSLDNEFLNTNGDNVVSGSDQVTESLDLRYLEIQGDGVISGSDQVTSSLDSRYLEISGDSVVSSSIQIDLTQTTNYSSGIKDILDIEEVISGSDQVTSSLDIRYLEINGDNVISGSDQVTSSLDGRYLRILGSNIVSGSSQVDITQTDGYDLFSESIDSRFDLLEEDQHTHTNKSNLDVINQDLATTDKPTFENINLPNLSSLPVSTEFSVLLYSESGEFVYSELGTAAYYHVSQSISQEDDNVIGTAGAMKRYIDEQLLIIGAGDITKITAGDGISGGAESGEAIINLDTGSTHFNEGVSTSINSFSSSVDTRLDNLELFSSSLDDDFVTQDELASATGALENSIATKLDTGSYNTDSQSFDLRLDNLELFSSSLDDDFVTQLELAAATSSLINSIDTKLDSSSFNSFTQSYTDDSQSFDLRIDSIEGVSGSYATTGSNNFVGDQFISGSITISGSVSDVKYVDFNTDNVSYPHQEGRVSWNHTEGTLNVDSTYSDVSLQVGQEFHIISRNATGTTIENGCAVYLSGVTAGSARPQISKFSADASVREHKFLGLATHNIGSGVNGIVTTQGYVRGLDTTGDSETAIAVGDENWQEGDTLYVHPTVPGKLTNVEPFHSIQVGFITQRHGSVGEIYVQGYSAGHLTYLHDVTIDTGSVSVGDLLVYDINNEGQWRNGRTLSGSYQIDNGDLTIDGHLSASSYSNVVSESIQIDVTQTTNYDEVVQISGSQTIIGTKTFQDIVVNGTGSFAYIQSVTGSAKIIGDAYIILNANSPSEQFAGIKVYDSGSSDTGSLEYDSVNNHWFYESTTEGYASGLISGPRDTRGAITWPSNNTIVKGIGGNHIDDSNITDDGSLITLGSNVQVNGNISLSGTVDGIDLQNFSQSVDDRIETLEDAATENPLTFNDTSTIDFSRVGDIITADIIEGSVSNGKLTNSSITINGTAVSLGGTRTLVTDDISEDGSPSNLWFTTARARGAFSEGTGVSISSGEISIGQSVGVSDTVQFGKVGVGGASDATYELKVTGDIGATGDVVAYVSSDERLKDEITPIENSLQKINSIGGYSFVWNEKQDIYKGKDYGVIAQEIEQVLPELVETRENGYKAVKYDRIVSLLIEGIKELNKEVSELKQQIGK
jgi:hypothetical protein